jgi:hypothetical protein
MNQVHRTTDACRDAGLPVVDECDCTCGLRGQLVVVTRPGGLEVIWPYHQRCPIHAPRDPDVARQAARPRRRWSRLWAAGTALATRKAGV